MTCLRPTLGRIYIRLSWATMAVALSTACMAEEGATPEPTPSRRGLVLSPPRAELEPGDRVHFVVTPRSDNPPPSDISWELSDPTVGTLSADGAFVARALGESPVVARIGDESLSASVRVGTRVAPEGGMVVSAKGDLRLDVPEGALTDDVLISLIPIEEPGLPSGRAWRMAPSDTVFAEAANLSLVLDEAASVVPGSDRVFHVRSSTTWVRLPTTRHDGEAERLTTTIDRLAVYAVFPVDREAPRLNLPPQSDRMVAWPDDPSIIDVKDWGALGDGRADDTAAIRAALAEAERRADFGVYTPIVFMPPGTYRVTETIEKRNASGHYDSGFMLQGAGRSKTVIRLDPSAPGFNDPAQPRAVLYTASHLWQQGGEYAGGKDYPGRGEGNQAFQNTIRDLTVEVGSGNPGAIGVDYLGNNNCQLRNVSIAAAAGSGRTGLALDRKWPGPCLIEDVSITGFDRGVHAGERTYGLTFSNIRLEGQREVGIRNEGNILSIAHLQGDFSVPAVVNADRRGLVVLAHAELRGEADVRAFENEGALRLIDVTTPGFGRSELDEAPAPGRDRSYAGLTLTADVPMPGVVAIAPSDPVREPPERWVSVTDFGANGADQEDDTAAFEAAFASGAATVYLPFGSYRISRPLRLGSSLRHLVGMNAELRVAERDLEGQPVLSTESPEAPLLIEDLRIRLESQNGPEGRNPLIRHASASPLVLRSILAFDPGDTAVLVDRAASGGPLSVLDVCCSRLHVEGPAPVDAYQLNSEGGGLRVRNAGSPLTILGLKTEGVNTALRTTSGGESLVLGGLLYPTRAVPERLPAFTVNDGGLDLGIAEVSFSTEQRYRSFVEVSEGRTIISGCTRASSLGTLISSARVREGERTLQMSGPGGEACR